MAKIKFGEHGHLELEITPLTIWSTPGSEGEFMEYQIGLYCQGESVFNPALAEKLVAVKDEETIYLSDFIAEVLAKRQESNWTMLEPKASFYMRPSEPPQNCCSAFNRPDNFFMQVTLEQNILAGEDKVFGPYSNTGLNINFEAPAKDWARFAQDIRAEEEDFEEDEEEQADETHYDPKN